MTDTVQPISIVVPVYREAANIEPLVRRTFAALGHVRFEGEMILVDDDSRDGTVEIVERLATDFPVRLSVRTDQRGLSSAVVHGFGLARNDILVVMDADLQHPPEAIPNMVNPVVTGQAEMTFGSRYAPGGQVAEQWPLLRRLASALATLLARPLVPLSDPMSGFFALHRRIWQQSEQVRPMGYKIGLEIAVKARCRRFAEVPIVFSTRHAGASKLTLRQQLQYVRHLLHLYWHRHKWWMVTACLLVIVAAAWALFATIPHRVPSSTIRLGSLPQIKDHILLGLG